MGIAPSLALYFDPLRFVQASVSVSSVSAETPTHPPPRSNDRKIGGVRIQKIFREGLTEEGEYVEWGWRKKMARNDRRLICRGSQFKSRKKQKSRKQ